MATKKSKKSKAAGTHNKTKDVRTKNLQPAVAQPDTFPIVGIGASAGGLEAYITFLKHLPLKTNMGFVIVQHQDPTHHSALTELLTKATRLPVAEVTDGAKIRANHIYVMPSNTNMHLIDGILKLNPRTAARGLHLPIDSFFQSLAQNHKERSIGVLLSGTASDGTLGLKAIKAAGGLTFAQDEKSAKYSGMPQHAIEAGVVDFVMPPDQIALQIAKIAQHPLLKRDRAMNVRVVSQDVATPQDEEIASIFQILRRTTGVNFTHYKPSTVMRRLSRRMLLRRIETFYEYAEFLRNDPKEVNALYEDILINVTNFFRDPETFETLKTEIFPKLFKSSAEKNLRIWVPGCSTGEEAYSIGMALMEYLGERGKKLQIQIFGTDISDTAIEKARIGFYSYDIQKDVSPERLGRFFVKLERGFQVTKMIRDLCIFAHHNVTKDPPFSKMDLISCRNLLIYLSPILQKKVFPIFHYSLNPNGYLLLGATENIGGFSDYFFPADRKHRIFSKKLIPARVHFDLAEHTRTERPVDAEKIQRPEPVSDKDILKEGDRLILTKYAPPSVIINEEMDILQFRGKTGRYLEPASGQASLNVIKMAREGYSMELRNAILRAKKEDRPVVVEDLETKVDGQSQRFSLDVIPFSPIHSHERYFLLSFNPRISEAKKKNKLQPKTKSIKSSRDNSHINRLENELRAIKEYLQSIIEEQEGTNEELRAANEEILSSNEELQSTNEEMETAKEELQSANEELTTVNEELHNRNIELKMSNNDLNNLLASVHIPTIMIGRDLRIRRFTPMAEKVLNLIASDVGRPITDINMNIRFPDLESWILDVIESMAHKEVEIADRRGHWYRLQIRPYQTVDNKIDGAVLVLIDVDMIKRSIADISKYKDYCEAIVDSAHESILILNGDLKIIMANRSFYRTFAIPKDVTGNNLNELGIEGWNSLELRKLLKELLPKNLKLEDYRIETQFANVGKKTLSLNASILRIENTGEQNILLAIEDITGKT